MARKKPGNKVFEIADDPVSFDDDVWKHFVFPVSRNEKKEKVTDQTTVCLNFFWRCYCTVTF